MTATDWLDDAACAGADAHLWFSEIPSERRQAAQVCSTCPVLDRCREYVLTMPKDTIGVWAGTTQAARKGAHSTDRPWAELMYAAEVHGTEHGYRRHKSRGETPCEDCHAATTRERQRRKDREARKRAGEAA